MSVLPHIAHEELKYCLELVLDSDSKEYTITAIDSMIGFLKAWKQDVLDELIHEDYAGAQCAKDDLNWSESRGY